MENIKWEPLNWSDFKMMATWMAEEIAGNYIMDKKSYNNQPPAAHYEFLYRKPVTLFHEERTIFALFIERVFWKFLKTGATSGFDTRKILQDIVRQTGLTGGYEKDLMLNALCYSFADKFPSFVHFKESVVQCGILTYTTTFIPQI